ncbi:MAG TPA: DUF1080 domain-containing protein [Saprospiraceae bacterium]|nr:DUF1080 domain-containing protein [Saprospiraceae bacterium]HMQ81919.1 DUF1080 domain-containing protein [Saprospiraceae bacterium]
MKRHFLFLSLFCTSSLVFAQITDPKATEVWEPQARVVSPGTGTMPPSDAIVLFDGTSLQEWVTAADGSAPSWTINSDGSMTVKPQSGDIKTKRVFGDIQLHLEFRTPSVVESEGQGRGNSGVFFQERYEVQVLDNYQNRTYTNGQAGSIYKQSMPLVNACRPPGEWQTYDIVFIAPRFNADGQKIASGRITVFHNGVLVQHYTEVMGTTEYIGLPKNIAHDKGSIKLQDHGNLVSYRNIWVREL